MAKRANGEGTVYSVYKKDKEKNILLDKNGNPVIDYWVAQYIVGKKDDGSPDKKSRYGKTRKEALAKIKELKIQVATNSYVEKNNITVYDLAKEIVEDKKNSNQISVSTYTRNKYTLTYIKAGKIADMPIQKVKAKDIKDFMNTTTIYANSTIEKIYQLLGQTFRRAIERDYIVKNPMLFEEVKKPKSNKKDKDVISLSIEEEKTLINAVIEENKPYKNIILLMLFTGLRIGEVLSLTVDDIDDKYIYINRTLTRTDKDAFIIGDTTKTKNSKRTFAITKIVKDILDNCKYVENPHKLLFYDETNQDIIKPYEVNAYISRLNQKYNIADKLHNHMFRHTYATRCIEAGMSIKVLQKKLGHKNIETTLNTYASVLDKFEESEDEKLDNYLQKNDIKIF